MRIDVSGRVKNVTLSSSRPLLPLFEAVVNSLQAIEDVGITDGSIQIEIIRDEDQLLANSAPDLGEIIGFTITDNGIGFDSENYSAFETADTTYKADRGGKGIGRFLWLAAFERVEVSSTFEEESRMKLREFEFSREGDGIKDMSLLDAENDRRQTTVKLMEYRDRFRKHSPKKIDTIASRIIEHCLEFLIRHDCPKMTLIDKLSNEIIDLNDYFEEEMAQKSDDDQIVVEGNRFSILHIRLHSRHELDHLVHYCANSRVVLSEKIMGRVPNVTRLLQDENGDRFVYAAYVDGELLDNSVNPERTGFNINRDASELFTDGPTWGEIDSAVMNSAKVFLQPFTEPVRISKRERIDEFVAQDGPMYGPILKHVEPTIDEIDPEIDDDELDIQLYDAYHKLQVELKREGNVLLGYRLDDEEWKDFSARLERYFTKVADINMSDLARYVCHRRAILDFLERQLSITESGKYRTEDRIHNIIFPMRETSKDVFFDEHNLWIVDEKLVYHAFLASDKPLSTTPKASIESSKEPDILVFDKAVAFTTGNPPYSAVTIIEFKRPMRTLRDREEDNPLIQLRKYITAIREGKARTPIGRDIPIVAQNVPFYCYLICDIDDVLETHARDFDLTKNPDNQGFFGWNRAYNAYFEVISYSKMVMDAKKRNVAFFDKLSLPTTSNPK